MKSIEIKKKENQGLSFTKLMPELGKILTSPCLETLKKMGKVMDGEKISIQNIARAYIGNVERVETEYQQNDVSGSTMSIGFGFVELFFNSGRSIRIDCLEDEDPFVSVIFPNESYKMLEKIKEILKRETFSFCKYDWKPIYEVEEYVDPVEELILLANKFSNEWQYMFRFSNKICNFLFDIAFLPDISKKKIEVKLLKDYHVNHDMVEISYNGISATIHSFLINSQELITKIDCYGKVEHKKDNQNIHHTNQSVIDGWVLRYYVLMEAMKDQGS